MEIVLQYIPEEIRKMIRNLPHDLIEKIEEIRLRIGRPVEVSASGLPHFLHYIFTKEDADQFISKLANHSFYTLDEELKKGYITIAGGHRVGLAGKVILENGYVKAIRHLASFNIRIAREKIGVAEKYVPYLFDQNWKNTMIIGAPQAGKTTLLRDLARIASGGMKKNRIPSLKVGIVDERSEIAGCVHGEPQLHLGPRVDVLDACPKAEGMMMMIRSMSPDILIVDEIGRQEDSAAILEAVNAGIKLIMTTHGRNITEVKNRPMLKEIFEQSVFERVIGLSREKGPGTVTVITDAEGHPIINKTTLLHHA
ncbi:stage III sporulation protein AA [Lederbergia lenta]|uniref:Stage III sporulation protein AA n=1 Tax=Lederbergia lenta TaxID=1467 RepID=A0A2X4VZJ9_LEDLE|nr:stage III sporulation protein AA [Lederbergia lenta]MEC2325148.1 stage III sporulation protein AA [Lederbergia lenta]SQI56213.1 stage III sporulation protein AA [Lederbergia lenta]